MKKVVIITTFIWIGFVCAISFMESWLKFQAPNITTKLGVGIGKLVFEALNNVEITFAGIIITSLAISSLKTKGFYFSYALAISIFILILQTFWILPVLSERPSLIIQDIQIPKSNLHFLFILLETIKITCLTIFGIKFLNLKNVL